MEVNEFASLLNKEFKPQTDGAKSEIENAVQTLAQQALASSKLISSDVVQTINAMVAEIDRKLSEQINQIMHSAEFQQLESAWRGLHYLVSNSETDDQLKIRVMNVSKKDLHKTLKRYKGAAWDQSPIFKKLYEEEYGTLGGEPFGCLVGDYYFDHGPMDVELLGEMAKVAAAAHAPFLAAAAPTVFQMESWQELSNPRDLDQDLLGARVRRLALAARVRRCPLSRVCACRAFSPAVPTAPRPTRSRSSTSRKMRQARTPRSTPGPTRPTPWPSTSTARSSSTAGARASAASSPAARWKGLPTHTFPTDDGGVDLKCPTEIAISDRREAELAKNGFMPLIYKKNSDFAAFIGAQSLQKPATYDDPDASSNAALAARLPYLFATCRFAHYLKCIVRDKIGSFREADGHAALAAELDHQLRRRRSGPLHRKTPRRASHCSGPRSSSSPSKATLATTNRSSSFVRTTSLRD